MFGLHLDYLIRMILDDFIVLPCLIFYDSSSMIGDGARGGILGFNCVLIQRYWRINGGTC